MGSSMGRAAFPDPHLPEDHHQKPLPEAEQEQDSPRSRTEATSMTREPCHKHSLQLLSHCLPEGPTLSLPLEHFAWTLSPRECLLSLCLPLCTGQYAHSTQH